MTVQERTRSLGNCNMFGLHRLVMGRPKDIQQTMLVFYCAYALLRKLLIILTLITI